MINYPTCKTCKHWRSKDSQKGKCLREGESYPFNPTDFVAQGSAPDDHGMQTWLETGPDFGCTHYEPKD